MYLHSLHQKRVWKYKCEIAFLSAAAAAALPLSPAPQTHTHSLSLFHSLLLSLFVSLPHNHREMSSSHH